MNLICKIFGHQWWTTLIPGMLMCKRCELCKATPKAITRPAAAGDKT